MTRGSVSEPYPQQQGVVMGKATPALYTVEEAAKLLRIGRTKAYALTQEWRATGGASGLPVVDFGHVLRVPRAALETLLGVSLATTSEAPSAEVEAVVAASVEAPAAPEASGAATASRRSQKRRGRSTPAHATNSSTSSTSPTDRPSATRSRLASPNPPAGQTGARGRRPAVLRVTTIHASSAGDSARYYTRYLAQDSPDGEGRWLGRQADELGWPASYRPNSSRRSCRDTIRCRGGCWDRRCEIGWMRRGG